MGGKILSLLLIPVFLFANPKIDSLKNELNYSSDQRKIEIMRELINYYHLISVDSVYKFSKMGLELANVLKDSTNFYKFYLNISAYYHHTFDDYKEIQICREALKFFYNHNDSSEIGYCFMLLAYYYYNNCDIDSSRYYLKKAFNLYSTLNNIEGQIYCYINQSAIELFTSNYVGAMEANLKVLLIKKEENINSSIPIDYGDGQLFYELKNYSKSYTFFKNALNLIDRMNNNFQTGLFLFNLSRIFFSTSKIDSARIYGVEGYEIFQKTRCEIHYPLYLNNLGDIELALGDELDAIKYYEEALAIAKRFKNKWYTSYSLQRLGHYYQKGGNYRKAINHYLNSNILARKIKARDLTLDNHFYLAESYEKIGNRKLAVENLKRYITLKDSIFFMNQDKITDLQIEYHTESLKKEKEIVEKNNAIFKLEAEKQKLLKTRFILGFLIATILSLLIIYLYYHKQRHNKILQKRIEEALREQREQQEIIAHQSGLTALGELAAGVAHEISQPLQNINLNAETIGMENMSALHPNAEIQKNVREIGEYIHRIHSIIEHIRLFSSRQHEEIYEQFNINETVKNAYHMVRKQFSKQGIQVKMDLTDDIVTISGNPYQFERVILNLLLNARDAVVDKSQRVNGGYFKEISLRTFCPNGEIVIEVIDNGIGVRKEEWKKIFEPFYSTKKAGQGQGLGLTIANRIIHRMGGRIELESEVLTGTIMRIYLPHSIAIQNDKQNYFYGSNERS